MENGAFLPKLEQDLFSIFANERDSRHIRHSAPTLFGKDLTPTKLQFPHPRAGEATFQAQSDNSTRSVQCDSQHNATTGEVTWMGLTPMPRLYDTFYSRVSRMPS